MNNLGRVRTAYHLHVFPSDELSQKVRGADPKRLITYSLALIK